MQCTVMKTQRKQQSATTDERKVLKMKQPYLQFRPHTSPASSRPLLRKSSGVSKTMDDRGYALHSCDTINTKVIRLNCDVITLSNYKTRALITSQNDKTVPQGLAWQQSNFLDIKTWPEINVTEKCRIQSAPKRLVYLTKKGSFQEHPRPRPATVAPYISRNLNGTVDRNPLTRAHWLGKTSTDCSRTRHKPKPKASVNYLRKSVKFGVTVKSNANTIVQSDVTTDSTTINEHILKTAWSSELNEKGQSVNDDSDSSTSGGNEDNSEDGINQNGWTENISMKVVIDIKRKDNVKDNNENETTKPNENEKNTEINEEFTKCTYTHSIEKKDILQQNLLHHLKETVLRDRKRRRVKIKTNTNTHHQCVKPDNGADKRKTTGLFLRAIQFVQRVVRLLASMVDHSAEMTSRSATEEQWHALNTSPGAREMAFNKTVFAKKKGASKVPNWARDILEKPPEERTQEDLRKVHALLRGLKSFDKFTEKIQLSMCRSFTYHSVNSGRIILRQGHVGVNFYFLHTGSVFVNIDDTNAHGDQFVKTEVVLKRGDSFGELALLQDIKRTATVSCREDCELLVVDKDTFAKVCPKIFEKELDEKIAFLSRLNLFNNTFWSKEALQKMCFEAQIQEYKTNKVVVADTLTDEWIYICMEGKCQVIRRFNVNEEIEWRKIQQTEINRRESLRHHATGNDVIDLVGLIGTRTNLESYGGTEKRPSFRSIEEGRQRLLDSMGLEYRQTRRMSIDDMQSLLEFQRKYRGTARSESRMSVKAPKLLEGPLTLTALLAQEEQEDTHTLHLSIKTLRENDIFDIFNILNHDESDSSGSYILVSSGARLMRMKRSSFYRYVTTEGIQHAKTVADNERNPSDDTLLRCFRDYLKWEIYKYSVLDRTLTAQQHIHNSQPRSNRNHTVSTTFSRSFDKNKHVLHELEHVLEHETDRKVRIRHWKQNEQLSAKSDKIAKTKQCESINKGKTPSSQSSKLECMYELDDYVEQPYGLSLTPQIVVNFPDRSRRSTTETGLLRRESLYVDVFSQKRLSVPQRSDEFTTIPELDERLTPSSQNKHSIYP